MEVQSKIIIELRFKRPLVPRRVLQEAVLELSERKGEFIDKLREYDPDIEAYVWYEDYRTVENIRLPDLLGKLLRRK